MEAEIENAIKLLRNNGYRITTYGKEGVFLIRCPKLNREQIRYSVRQTRTTSRDKINKWPNGTEIARINEKELKWEPIIP